jgi:hypothetical protein
LQNKEREDSKGREMKLERANKRNEKQIRKKGTKKMNLPIFRKGYSHYKTTVRILHKYCIRIPIYDKYITEVSKIMNN